MYTTIGCLKHGVSGGGGGAFPTPRTPAFSSSGVVTNRVVTLPAGIAAGDLMVVLLQGVVIAGTTTPPAGWALVSGGWGSGSPDGVWWKIAVGGETTATFTSAAANGSTAHCAMAFQGAQGPPEYAYVDLDGTSSMNCPSITASWGSANNLFCAVNYWSDTSDYPTSYPASYTLMQATESPATVGYRTSARQLAAATDNPGSQTTSGNLTTAKGLTFAIRPA